MSDLTLEQIEAWRNLGASYVEHMPDGERMFITLCNMALRSLVPSATAATDMVLVPMEPTKAMRNAGAVAIQGNGGEGALDVLVTDAVCAYEAMIAAAPSLPVEVAAITDKDRMDWLEKSIFHREMNEWDKKYAANSNMWVLFAPNGVQGSARRIVDAAIERDRSCMKSQPTGCHDAGGRQE